MTTTPKGWAKNELHGLPFWSYTRNGNITEISVMRIYNSNIKTPFYVRLAKGELYSDSYNIKKLESFKTKSEAESFAIRWMRQHPNG